MNDSQKNKLDELLSRSVELRPQPDFAQWCLDNPEAVDALKSQANNITKRRSKMIRLTRYSMSAAAILLIIGAGVWWLVLSQGARRAWAEAIEQLAQIHNATCVLHTHRGGFEQISNGCRTHCIVSARAKYVR